MGSIIYNEKKGINSSVFTCQYDQQFLILYVLKYLNIYPQEYVLIRYIAYDVHHDMKDHLLPES
jgi:hypothetical protein